MRHKRTGRRLLRLFLGVGLALAILLVWGAALRETQNWRMARAMSRFRTAPNGEHAHELIRAIANRTVTPAQGERILTLLLRPEITIRTAYPAGQPAKISVGRPVHIEMPQGWIEFEQQVWANGQQIDASRKTSHNVLFGFPEILTAWVGPLEPGTYHPEIRIAGRIRHAARSSPLWDRLYAWLRGHLLGPPIRHAPAGSEPTYECHFTVPFDVNIVARDPAIKALWNGTLEFPISFSVYVKTTTR